PIGKYRPWIIASAPVMAIAIWALMAPLAHPTGLYLILWLLVFYLGGSMFNLAQAAWAASLASDYAERPRVFGWMQIIGILAGLGPGRVPLRQASPDPDRLRRLWGHPDDPDGHPRWPADPHRSQHLRRGLLRQRLCHRHSRHGRRHRRRGAAGAQQGPLQRA